jgi:putative spermidine/putrescine transport system ATP-binding protein
MLELRALTKDFDGATAVANLTLTVPRGSLVALLGPSGCGKTTTLRMIAGLTAPSGGHVVIDGHDMADIPPERRNVGMVFQRYVLFPHMTAARNISFGLRMRRVSAAEIARRTAEMLDVVQLSGFEQRFPSQLSGGQQQRVAIARALITRPHLLLMDEPLSNLDARLREEMRGFIKGLQRRLNITTVFVTHDQIEAMELADRIGVMFRGELVQYDVPDALFNEPRTPEVAEFMGATNFLRGRLRGVNGTLLLDTALGPLAVAQDRVSGEPGREATATIRPEHVGLELGHNVAGDNRVRGLLTQRVFYGGTLMYSVRVGEQTFRVQELSTRALDEGQPVTLTLKSRHLWVFPEIH